MVDISDSYRKLNDIDLVSITMSSEHGGQVNLSGICKHISIFEDINYPFLSAELKIIDARSIMSHFPITGNETVNIQYKTPGIGSNTVDITLEVMAVSGREKSRGERSEIYTLHLKSKNTRLDSSRKVHGAYEGRISEIASNISNKFLSINKSGSLFQKTKGEYKFVIPGMRPVQAIKWLSSMCTSEAPPHNADFHFFETVDGANFVSLGTLSRSKAHRSYHTRPSSVSRGDIYESFLRIQDLKISKDFNRELDVMSGGMACNLVTHDLTYKDIQYYRFNHIQDFDSSDHVDDHRTLPTNSKYLASFEGPFYFSPKQSMNFGDLYPQNYNQEDYMLKSISTRSMWNQNKISITVPGDSTLRVGQVVEVIFPSNEPKNSNDVDWYSKYESGRYVISALRHVIFNESSKDYTCMLEISRDSLPVMVPSDKKFLGTSINAADNSESVFV